MALRGEWHDAVLAKARRSVGGRRLCAVTGVMEHAGDRLTGHHVIERAKLRDAARRLGRPEEEVVWDPRNGLPVLWSRHERHTSRIEPIPRSALLPENVEFAEEIGLGWLLERIYP